MYRPPSYLLPGAFGSEEETETTSTPQSNADLGLPPDVTVTSTAGVSKKQFNKQKKALDREKLLNKNLDPCTLQKGAIHIAFANEEPCFYLCKIVCNDENHLGRLTAVAKDILDDKTTQDVKVRWCRIVSKTIEDKEPYDLKWKHVLSDPVDNCCASLIGPVIKINQNGTINANSKSIFKSVMDWVEDDEEDENSEDDDYDEY